MPGISEFMEKIFGKGIAQKLQERADPQGILGTPRTPSFIPSEVGQELGAKFGGTLPEKTFSKDAPTFKPAILEQKPQVPLATPAPNLGITPHALNQRMANPNTGAEFKQRQQEMGMAAPPEVVYRRPFEQERYDYVTNGGTQDPNQRGWKELVKNALAGFAAGAQGGDVGAGIGGAIAGAGAGLINPAAGREMRFNTLRLPRLVQERQMDNEQAMMNAKQAQIGADIQYKRSQDEMLRREQKRKENAPVSIGAAGSINPATGERIDPYIKPGQGATYQKVGDDGQVHLYAVDNVTGQEKHLGIAGQPYTQKQLEELRQRGQNARTGATIESREKIAGQTDERQRAIAAMNEGGRRTRHKASGGNADAKRKVEADRWFTALQNALGSSLGNNATPEIKQAMDELRKYPEYYETGIGEGEWPYAKPRQSAAPQAQGGKRILMSKLKQHGLSREAAEAAGYTVVDQ